MFVPSGEVSDGHSILRYEGQYLPASPTREPDRVAQIIGLEFVKGFRGVFSLCGLVQLAREVYRMQ